MVAIKQGRPSLESNLSTTSSESMVEIKRVVPPSAPGINANSSGTDEDDKYRLLYSKSKVYVNPTAYARDNIPGFVTIVKREAVNPIYLLAWIPESLLNEKGTDEWDKFMKVEEHAPTTDDDEDIVFIDLPLQRPESYAFSVPVTSIYSLFVQPPTLSSWYGSIGVNLINGDTLPTLHFHDDESRSFTLQSPRSTTTSTSPNVTPYPPPPTSGSSHIAKTITSWGGEDLMSRLRNYAHLLRSTLQPTLFLVDPSRADVEAHSTQIFEDDAVDDILAQSSFANSHSPVPAHRRPRPISNAPGGASGTSNPYSQRTSVLHRSLGSPPTSPISLPGASSASQAQSQARLALLQSFSNITRATRHAAQNILSHPLAKPIVPHLPDPVKSLVNVNGDLEWGSWVEKGGVGEFESARVYLARWARIVAEEGERARRKEARVLPVVETKDGASEEDSSLGIFELLHSTANLPTPKTTRDPAHPIDEKVWMSWFDAEGRPKLSFDEMRKEVFRRGISGKGTLRQKVWPYVLSVYEWDVTRTVREKKWEEKKARYQAVKDEWCGVPDVFDSPKVLEERHRIDVDCRRTDRNQPLFSAPAEILTTDIDDEKAASGLHQRHHSIISPNMNEIGAQSPSNEHVDRMASILLTYNFYEKELDSDSWVSGYVQGMSDLCAPIYVVMAGDEEMTFWCFVEVMNRMKQNFLRDQSGMKKQLSTLQQLIEVMDPELFRHLEKTDGLNLFFCFRWVLISFKREFPFDDVLRLWEVLWTDYYTTGFVLFVALAVLESHRDMMLRYLVEFDEILKYCNELSMTIELDTTLAQAEVLYLSFAQIVADIDRRKAEQESSGPSSSNNLRRRLSTNSAKLAATNLSAFQISDELRELLGSDN
ncbi:rab-GTPase-TBC domain-containing protein [Crepidotus variabilis]|uniref:Rab-GTPase-TBC domain-containing protein n=1 Tax=Crepidotus variabilis TaxID=179855 RepID=A0A9P6EPS4_9AGAR|nr:rab-GTPase-TBC domain-containing protein [Crepidotus variabilis]